MKIFYGRQQKTPRQHKKNKKWLSFLCKRPLQNHSPLYHPWFRRTGRGALLMPVPRRGPCQFLRHRKGITVSPTPGGRGLLQLEPARPAPQDVLKRRFRITRIALPAEAKIEWQVVCRAKHHLNVRLSWESLRHVSDMS